MHRGATTTKRTCRAQCSHVNSQSAIWISLPLACCSQTQCPTATRSYHFFCNDTSHQHINQPEPYFSVHTVSEDATLLIKSPKCTVNIID